METGRGERGEGRRISQSRLLRVTGGDPRCRMWGCSNAGDLQSKLKKSGPRAGLPGLLALRFRLSGLENNETAELRRALLRKSPPTIV